MHASDIKMLLTKMLHARQHADTSYTEKVADAGYFESNRRNLRHFATCYIGCNAKTELRTFTSLRS